MRIETHLMELKHYYWLSALGSLTPAINAGYLKNKSQQTHRKQPLAFARQRRLKTSPRDLRIGFLRCGVDPCFISNFDIYFSFILSRMLSFLLRVQEDAVAS